MKLKSAVIFLVFCGELAYSYGAVIHETLLPDNSSCLEPGDFGCLCSHSSECDSRKHMECIDYKCFCLYPMHRIFDNSLRECVGLVGAKCEMKTGSAKCIRNAECEDGRCVCREGYSVTNKLMCMTSFNEECGPFQCNIDRGLACKSGICVCLDSSYTYSAVTRKCFDPEAFVANFIRTFGPTFIQEAVIHKTFRIIRKLLDTLTSPFKHFGFG